MQFQFRVDQIFQADKEGFVVLHGHQLGQRIKGLKAQQLKGISEVITSMGNASAKAQSLKQVITTFEKFVGSDNRIYLKIEGNKVLGLLKIGQKNLFHRDYVGSIKEIKPTCVLDFYVHESCQRSGVGKEIFQMFLIQEGKHPAKLAYDRPSQKLINFLKKHYGLVKYIPQNNNFVVFNQYFEPLKDLVPPIITAKQPPRKEIQSMKEVLKPQTQPKEPIKEDTIDQLRKEFSTLTARERGNDQKKYQLSSPWAQTFIQRSVFRTTSNTYGSHYK